MNKTDQIYVRVHAATKAALELAARKDTRTLSSLIEKILTEWLIANGKLKQDKIK